MGAMWSKPEAALRSGIRRIIGKLGGSKATPESGIAREVLQLLPEVTNSGLLEDGTPFVELKSGRIFHGLPDLPVPRKAFDAAAGKGLSKQHLAILAGIVWRYRYPHADAAATPPYTLAERRKWHPQHRDTIDELPIDVDKEKLKEVFAIREGMVVLDVGSFMGFGAMRLAEVVGDKGRIVSFEANPMVQKVCRYNLEANALSNVTLIPCGAWDTATEIDLQCDGQQANSLVKGAPVVGESNVRIQTITIDEVVTREQLSQVDLVSLTINGAEPEAIRGMTKTLTDFKPPLTIAGWYDRGDGRVSDLVCSLLDAYGYKTLVGPVGRVYAWHESVK